MDQETFSQHKDSRREHLYGVMREAALSRMEQALPALENMILNTPLMSVDDFEIELTNVAQEYRLNKDQKSIARFIFGNYQRDIEGIREYRDLVFGDEQTSENPMRDIEASNKAKGQLLNDIGVINESNTVTLDDFTIDASFSACFIILYRGEKHNLYRAMDNDKTIEDSSGIFITRFILDEDEQSDPLKSHRIPLLDNRVIMVIDDPYDNLSLNRPDQTKKHELLHYVFSQYLKDQVPETSERYLDHYIRNEIHSYFGSETSPRLNLEKFFPLENSDFSQEGYNYFENIQQRDDIFDLFVKLKSIQLSGAEFNSRIRWLALSTQNIGEMNTKLNKITDTEKIKDAFLEMGDVIGENEGLAAVGENIAWLNLWIDKTDEYLGDDNDIKEKYSVAVRTYLNIKVVNLSGRGRKEIYNNIPVLVEDLRALEARWEVKLPHSNNVISEAIVRALRRFNQEKQTEKREFFWDEFVQQSSSLDNTVGDLARLYHKTNKKTWNDKIERREIENKLESDFESWLIRTGKNQELEREELR